MFAGLFGWAYTDWKKSGFMLSGPGYVDIMNKKITFQDDTTTNSMVMWRTYPDTPYAYPTDSIPSDFKGKNLFAHQIGNPSDYLTATIKDITGLHISLDDDYKLGGTPDSTDPMYYITIDDVDDDTPPGYAIPYNSYIGTNYQLVSINGASMYGTTWQYLGPVYGSTSYTVTLNPIGGGAFVRKTAKFDSDPSSTSHHVGTKITMSGVTYETVDGWNVYTCGSTDPAGELIGC